MALNISPGHRRTRFNYNYYTNQPLTTVKALQKFKLWALESDQGQIWSCFYLSWMPLVTFMPQ